MDKMQYNKKVVQKQETNELNLFKSKTKKEKVSKDKKDYF